MSPTPVFLLGLIALIPQVFSISIPANPAAGLTNTISVDTSADNPLPPSPPGWYHVPGTSIAVKIFGNLGPPIPSQDALSCLAAAQINITNTIAVEGDVAIPRPGWQFVDFHVHLGVSAPFRGLGTYTQLSYGLTGLLHLITMQGGPGARQLGWVVSDDVQGIVMSGAMGPYPRIGALQASATAVSSMSSGIVASSGAMATATQSASIVGFKELATS